MAGITCSISSIASRAGSSRPTWPGRATSSPWELSAANPILTPGPGDGINASDPDLVEYDGQTQLYYSVGDQRTWSKLKRAIYPAPLRDFFRDAFAGGAVLDPFSGAGLKH